MVSGIDAPAHAERCRVEGLVVESHRHPRHLGSTVGLHRDGGARDVRGYRVHLGLGGIDRLLEDIGGASRDTLADDAVVRLLRFHVFADAGERASEPELEGGCVNQLVGPPELVLSRLVVLLVERRLALAAQVARRRAVPVGLGERRARSEGEQQGQRSCEGESATRHHDEHTCHGAARVACGESHFFLMVS